MRGGEARRLGARRQGEQARTARRPGEQAAGRKDVREAQRYFVELYAAFASWPEHDHWSAVRIDRTTWRVVALEPTVRRQWTPILVDTRLAINRLGSAAFSRSDSR